MQLKTILNFVAPYKSFVYENVGWDLIFGTSTLKVQKVGRGEGTESIW